MPPPPMILGLAPAMSAGGGRTTAPRIRISRPDAAQDAALQELGLSAKISLRSRCRLQHLQRPTPPHFRFNASHFPRRGDEHVARGSHGCLEFQELPLIVLFRRQRDKASGSAFWPVKSVPFPLTSKVR